MSFEEFKNSLIYKNKTISTKDNSISVDKVQFFSNGAYNKNREEAYLKKLYNYLYGK